MNSNISELLGINEEHSTPDIPVFEKSLPKDVWGVAKMDRTIEVNSKLNKKDIAKVVRHEKEHVIQMRKGLVSYDNKNVYYRKHPLKQFLIFPRNKIKTGSHSLPWEKDVYNKTGEYPS